MRSSLMVTSFILNKILDLTRLSYISNHLYLIDKSHIHYSSQLYDPI